ncbi:MAG: hypothetical protein GZ091_04585 [Paludibacter sp.]|nr:hypothetical protein [Paludibacter sp.]
MRKRIAILSLVAIFISVSAVTAQTTVKKEAVKSEVKCEKKADATATKCCSGKSDADCCKNKKAGDKTACATPCKKETAKTDKACEKKCETKTVETKKI